MKVGIQNKEDRLILVWNDGKRRTMAIGATHGLPDFPRKWQLEGTLPSKQELEVDDALSEKRPLDLSLKVTIFDYQYFSSWIKFSITT